MNKFDRVVTILMLLQTKRIVRAQDLADRFEVSQRTIYRDLRTLEHAGVPIHAEAGIGYSLVEGYNLPPVMFSENEATSFLVAEKLVEKMTDEDTAYHFSGAVNKIKAVLRSHEKEKINNLEHHIHVSKLPMEKDNGEQRMPLIFSSIDSGTILKMTYEAIYNHKVTVRYIEPLGLHFYGDNWHLIAFCQLRQDYRDFRVDRIKELETTAGKFSGEHPNLTEYLDQMAQEQDLVRVRVLFKNSAEQYARSDKFYYGYVSEEKTDNGIEMEFLVPSLHGIAHWLLVYVDNIEVLDPPILKGMMKGLAKRLVENYSNSETP